MLLFSQNMSKTSINARVLAFDPVTRKIEVAADSERLEFTLGPHCHDPTAHVGSFMVLEVECDEVRNFELISEGKIPQDWTGEFHRLDQTSTAKVSRRDLLFARQCMLRVIRKYFEEQGFYELEAPLLVRGTCPDLYIDSFELAGGNYLTTSTEYHIKRMVVAGFKRVFTLTKNFRPSEVGRYHNPEFTMLEWSRAFATLADIECDAEELTKAAFNAVYPGATTVKFNGYTVQIQGVEWERLSVRDALKKHLDVNVSLEFQLDELLSATKTAGIHVPTASQHCAHDIVTLLLDAVQPRLGLDRPTFLTEWPAFMTSSAALSDEVATIAERSELFIAGVEVADGFPSMRGSAKQQSAFEAQLARRDAAGRPRVLLDQAYLRALEEGIPPSAGMALGFDRLVMVLTGANQIRETVAFAWDER